MNVLAVATTLLPKDKNIYDNDLLENLREIYFSGDFDMLLIMSSDNNFDTLKFSFAKVVWQKISPVNTEECIAKVLGKISKKFGKSCSFTVLYDSDEQANEIAKHVESLQGMCFMRINDKNSHEKNFTPIDCDDENIDYNFFYAKIANYVCKHKIADTETLFSKVNKLKRMNIHWVIAKPRNMITYKVRS